MCLHVEMPIGAEVVGMLNEKRVEIPLLRLLQGAWADRMGKIGSAAYRFHRAPRQWEVEWSAEFEDSGTSERTSDDYYIRVRQMNDQWAWSSPIRVIEEDRP
jgi:hypothetical protein